MATTPDDLAVKQALSVARLGTYESATTTIPLIPSTGDAVALYAWNAQVSAAMLMPLHICEVAIRNAVADAIESVYGHQWPWSQGFIQSLSNPAQGYNPKQDLWHVAGKFNTPGKVIPELKFAFWQSMFTSRFDGRIWNQHLRTVLPHLNQNKTVLDLRKTIYSELEQLRKLRNRIAHHEPIFTRKLADDFQKTSDLISLRCPTTAAWMVKNQQATEFISLRP